MPTPSQQTTPEQVNDQAPTTTTAPSPLSAQDLRDRLLLSLGRLRYETASVRQGCSQFLVQPQLFEPTRSIADLTSTAFALWVYPTPNLLNGDWTVGVDRSAIPRLLECLPLGAQAYGNENLVLELPDSLNDSVSSSILNAFLNLTAPLVGDPLTQLDLAQAIELAGLVYLGQGDNVFACQGGQTFGLNVSAARQTSGTAALESLTFILYIYPDLDHRQSDWMARNDSSAESTVCPGQGAVAYENIVIAFGPAPDPDLATLIRSALSSLRIS